MKPVEISEISNIAEYEVERETLRPKMIALKDRRRVRVGDHLTFLFENRETVRYQIQEMMRVERIVKAHDIAHEVATYNELVPGQGELCASLLVEYETPAERDVKLRELLGLEHHIWVEVEGAGRTPAIFDDRQIATDRISAVQYLRFRLSEAQRTNWSKGAAVVSDHPKYQAAQPLNAAQLVEIGNDFR